MKISRSAEGGSPLPEREGSSHPSSRKWPTSRSAEGGRPLPEREMSSQYPFLLAACRVRIHPAHAAKELFSITLHYAHGTWRNRHFCGILPMDVQIPERNPY